MKKKIASVFTICVLLITILIFVLMHNGQKEKKLHVNENITKTQTIEDVHITKKDFDPNNIQISKLPQKEYDYNSSAASMDFENNYIRLDSVVSDNLKVYSVGDWEQKSVLIVYKDSSYYTGWQTDPSEPIKECMLFDFDRDGEGELAICTYSDIHHNNLYIVELSDNKLWECQKIECYDSSIDEYIWKHLSYSYREDENAIVFSSRSGLNLIGYDKESFPNNNEFLKKKNQPETRNNRRIIIGGYTYNDSDGPWLSIPLYSEAQKPNFSNYNLNRGDLVLCVSIDRVQGSNYGDVYIKLKYQEDGIKFNDFAFLNNYDICR